MLDDHFLFLIQHHEDFANYDKDYDKVDHVHLELKDKTLSTTEISEVLVKIINLNPKHAHFDFSYLKLNDNNIINLCQCLYKWKLQKCNLNFKNVHLTDWQFKTLTDTLMTQSDLEKLTLNLCNTGINDYRLKKLERLINKLYVLITIDIDISYNHINSEDIVEINKVIQNIKTHEFKWV